ncbi:hypothetical protein [Methanoculleus bourgensis]|uniref:Uncharacterized protein n=1 Tax=Methanoculleus bourgensis TaxID=83986 RepID=A0A110BIT8_9EURY|nr:hypothetical protein [Methanoculleus bourgensis]CVK34426.1 protein of unknown function [Methanoculleus bourgensis]
MEIVDILNTTTIPLSEITLEKVILAVIVAVIGWIVVRVLISAFTKALSRASHLPGLHTCPNWSSNFLSASSRSCST